MISDLKEYGINVTVYDSWAKSDEDMDEYKLDLLNNLPNNRFDVVVLTVAH